MNSISIESDNFNDSQRKSLRRMLLEKARRWIDALLQAEMTEHLGRQPHESTGETEPNYRNGYRPRKLNLLGLGQVELRVPRDRRGEYRSQLLPERRGQDEEFEAFVAECFLAGLSTRDVARNRTEALRDPVRQQASEPDRGGSARWRGGSSSSCIATGRSFGCASAGG